MYKKYIKYFIWLLIFFLTILWLLDFNFSKKQFTFLKLKNIISKNNIALLKKEATSFIDFDFKLSERKNYDLGDRKVNFEKFSNKILKYRYYLEQDNEYVYLITNRGELFYFLKENIIKKKKIEIKKIKTNFTDIVDKKFINDSNLIVKEILLINEKIYVSYINNNEKCYSNAILEGNLNLKKIRFSKLVKLDECKKIFNLSMGGNIKKYKDNKILWTVGDFESYETVETTKANDPQNLNSYYGKILTFNLETKDIKILSMGHRNPQGLFYDSENDIVFSTEHGPQGGDEINVNISPNENLIKNYGWAISSYGEHYGEEQGWSERIRNDPNLLLASLGYDQEALKNSRYTLAPLYKSHKDYGFEEPIKYFTPSIGITEILKVEDISKDNHKLVVASMGYDKEEDDMTLHILDFDKNFIQKKYEKIYIGERIRDIINLGNGMVLMTIESSGSLGILKNVY